MVSVSHSTRHHIKVNKSFLPRSYLRILNYSMAAIYNDIKLSTNSFRIINLAHLVPTGVLAPDNEL